MLKATQPTSCSDKAKQQTDRSDGETGSALNVKDSRKTGPGELTRKERSTSRFWNLLCPDPDSELGRQRPL